MKILDEENISQKQLSAYETSTVKEFYLDHGTLMSYLGKIYTLKDGTTK